MSLDCMQLPGKNTETQQRKALGPSCYEATVLITASPSLWRWIFCLYLAQWQIGNLSMVSMTAGIGSSPSCHHELDNQMKLDGWVQNTKKLEK